MEIKIDDLNGREIQDLLAEHLRDMEPTAPPESRHALDLTGLQHESVTVWSLWDGSQLAGCGALKELEPHHGEIKSMRTAKQFLRQGVAAKLLEHILLTAKQRNYHCVSLETGSMEYFKPARKMYRKFGFVECPPFGEYQEDPNSVFMTKTL